MITDRTQLARMKAQLASWAAALAMAVGALVLVGWTFDIAALKSVLPGWVAMKANTAVCFVLIGVALWLTARPPATLKPQLSTFFFTFARLCLLLTGLIGLLTLGEYVFDWNPGLDMWLFHEPNGTAGTSYPGRMAPEAALSFVLLAAVLWITGRTRKTSRGILVAANFGVAVTVLALAAMQSYFTPALGPYGWFGFTIMAMHTALLFALLGIAITTMSWQQEVMPWSLGRNTTAAFACGMTVLVIIGFNTSRSQFWLDNKNDRISYNEAMLADMDVIVAELIDAQAHALGYVVTGGEQFKSHYLEAQAISVAKLEALRKLVADDPQQQRQLARIETHVHAQLQWLQQAIQTKQTEARQTGSNNAARNAMIAQGEDLLRSMHLAFRQIEGDHLQTIQQLDRESEKVSRLSYVIIFVGTLTSLLIFMAVIFRLNSVVNERKQADESMRKLSQAVEQSPSSIIITDLDANIEYVNKAFIDSTGYSFAETIGQNPRLLQSGKTPKEIYKDMWAHLKRGEAWKGELINRRRDGSVYTESVLMSPVRQADGRVTHYMSARDDITERKRTEDTLRESEEKFSKVFESNPAMVAIGTLDGTMVDVNLSYANFLGFCRQEMLGKSWADLEIVSAAELQRLLELGHRAGESLRDVEVTLRARGGKRLNALLSAEIVTLGGIRYRLATLQDITARKQAEAQLIEQLDELRRWHDVTSSREGRILDLKHEVNELQAKAGQPSRYPSAESKNQAEE